MVRGNSPDLKSGVIDMWLLHKPDFLVFSLVVFLAAKAKAPGLRIPAILATVVEDATRYFLVIFTVHFVIALTRAFARVMIFVLFLASRVMILNVCLSSRRYNFSQPRKSQRCFSNPAILTAISRCDQGRPRVRPISIINPLVRMTSD
jgi:hypothetical protein